jgi:hypothetical protein
MWLATPDTLFKVLEKEAHVPIKKEESNEPEEYF